MLATHSILPSGHCVCMFVCFFLRLSSFSCIHCYRKKNTFVRSIWLVVQSYLFTERGVCWARNEYLILCSNVNRVLFLCFYCFYFMRFCITRGNLRFWGRNSERCKRKTCYLEKIYLHYLSQAKAEVIWFIVKAKSKQNWFIFRFCYSPLNFVIGCSLCVITPTAYAK